MRKGNLFTKVKKATAVMLATAMVLSATPMQNVKAADDSPYVISQALSHLVDFDPSIAYAGSLFPTDELA